ncbi:energy-coupling factor ABC transporter permease [Sorangium sp. So ce131]
MFVLAVFLAALVAPRPAAAMHLAEGVLPLGWCAVWNAIALPFVAAALHALRQRTQRDAFYKPFVGLVAAAVFAISCMPVPVPTAGTCSHPCGTGLAAILIGPRMTVLVTVVALLLQALFLAHGGLTTLGADVASMGIAGAFAGYLAFRAAQRCGASLWVAGFLAGVTSDWATYATTALELALGLAGEGSVKTMFAGVALAFVPTQLPLGLLEGVMTAGALVFLRTRRPDILERLRVVPLAAGAP